MLPWKSLYLLIWLGREKIYYHWFEDDDAIRIFFVDTAPGMIEDTEQVGNNVTVDYDSENRFVSLEIQGPSFLLPCCRLTGDVQDERNDDKKYVCDRHFSPNGNYSPSTDAYDVFFVNDVPSDIQLVDPSVRFVKFYKEPRLKLFKKDGYIYGFRITDASRSVQRPER